MVLVREFGSMILDDTNPHVFLSRRFGSRFNTHQKPRPNHPRPILQHIKVQSHVIPRLHERSQRHNHPSPMSPPDAVTRCKRKTNASEMLFLVAQVPCSHQFVRVMDDVFLDCCGDDALNGGLGEGDTVVVEFYRYCGESFGEEILEWFGREMGTSAC